MKKIAALLGLSLAVVSPLSAAKTGYHFWDEGSDRLSFSKRMGNEPTAAESLHLLVGSLDTRVDAIDYPDTCENFINSNTKEPIETFGEFLPELLLSIMDSNQSSDLQVSWEQPLLDTHTNEILWHVTVLFNNQAIPESPLSCGVDFFISDEGREVLTPTLRCAGTC
uniref:hypothetical protein n=1 Tax=Thaumasiovibrio occultus TaxID=1891184 RepID=UPI000B3559C5|nr:hypothetical protein [Thaumasiovibrio occultus]